MAEIDRRNFQLLLMDELPNVHLGPIAERKSPHVFPRMDARIIKVPNFRALVLRIPLPETVAKAEEALFGTGLLFIPARAADAAIETELLDGSQKGGNLQAVAAGFTPGRHRHAFGHCVLHFSDNEPGAKPGPAPRAQLIDVWGT